MYLSTLSSIRCLDCKGVLELRSASEKQGEDILYGEVACSECEGPRSSYPILAGVLLYVGDGETALIRHMKGIMALVPDQKIPERYRDVYLEARESLAEDGFFDEGLEEDLEAERVTSLYVMNHYLKADQVPETGNPVMDELVAKLWDHGPLEKTAQCILKKGVRRVLELGSSVGGLAQRLPELESYLGVDASFASVALARHLALGASYPKTIRIPGDLIQGAVSITPRLPDPAWRGRSGADFILGDLRELSLVSGFFDGTVALGLIDMLEEPVTLVRLQHEILSALPSGPSGPSRSSPGWAVQASPYIWHEPVARALREGAQRQGLELSTLSSAQAIQALYREGGFDLDESLEALTWVFFKHRRQIELYAVHWSVHWSGHKCEP